MRKKEEQKKGKRKRKKGGKEKREKGDFHGIKKEKISME